MPVVGFRINVTRCTGKFSIIRSVSMTVNTLRPLSQVFTAVNRKKFGIMLCIFCRHPVRISGVTLSAIIRKISLNVVGTCGTLEIRLVACNTIIRCIGIISTNMALGTI